MTKAKWDEIIKLLEEFEEKLVPWCKENKLSLHKAFDLSRETDKEKYEILSGLYKTDVGKSFLKDHFNKEKYWTL